MSTVVEQTIGDLMRQYNVKLERYKRMEEWAATATKEELERYGRQAQLVIAECSEALNALTRHVRVSEDEVKNGFDI